MQAERDELHNNVEISRRVQERQSSSSRGTLQCACACVCVFMFVTEESGFRVCAIFRTCLSTESSMKRDRLTMATGMAVSISHGGSLTAWLRARPFHVDEDDDDDDEDDEDDDNDEEYKDEDEDEECMRKAASRMLPAAIGAALPFRTAPR